MGNGEIGAWPTQRVPDGNGNPFALRVDGRRGGTQAGLHFVVGNPAREIVATERVVVDVVGHHAAHQVVSVIEQQWFPGTPQDGFVGGNAPPLQQHSQFFRSRQQPFELPGSLLQFDPTAVSPLKDRIEVPAHDGPIGTPGDPSFKIGRYRDAQLERRIGLTIELLD